MTSNSVLTGGTYPASGTGSAVPATDVPVAVMVPYVVALAMWKVSVPVDPATNEPPLRTYAPPEATVKIPSLVVVVNPSPPSDSVLALSIFTVPSLIRLARR